MHVGHSEMRLKWIAKDHYCTISTIVVVIVVIRLKGGSEGGDQDEHIGEFQMILYMRNKVLTPSI